MQCGAKMLVVGMVSHLLICKLFVLPILLSLDGGSFISDFLLLRALNRRR